MRKKLSKKQKFKDHGILRQKQEIRLWRAQQKRKKEIELQRKLEKERRLRQQELGPRPQVHDPEPSSASTVNEVLNGVAASMGVVFRRSYGPSQAWSAIHIESGTTISAGTKHHAWEELLTELQKLGTELKPLPEWEMRHGGESITALRPEGATERSLRLHKTIVGPAGYRRHRK